MSIDSDYLVPPDYYDASYPPSLWGPVVPTPVKATGATAGIPGTWTPPGSDPAVDITDAVTVVASPATAWTTGQYVQTAVAGAPGRISWSGTAWVAGAAPAPPTGPGPSPDPDPDPPPPPDEPKLPEDVADFTIPDIKTWVDQHPHDGADVLAHELARGDAARGTLVGWLEGFVEAHDGVDP